MSMARSIWSGVLSFGLVAVPVRLYSATEGHEPSFHQFEKDTADRIRYLRVNERTGEEVPYADIVRGADVGDGSYVMLSQDELDSVAPGQSRSLDVAAFVDLEEIDPIYFNKTYFLAPGSEATKKTYALLRDAMAASGKAAIGSFVMRGKEYLAAVRADGDLLVLETLFFADEVRNPHEEIDDLPGAAGTTPQELKMATQLIGAMSASWEPSDYRDTYTDRIKQLISAKKDSQEVAPAAKAPAATNVTSLMEALQASLDSARKDGAPAAGSGSGGRKRAPAKAKAAGAGAKPAAGSGSGAAAKSAPSGSRTKRPTRKGAA
jgi:DNA end-binding protein Ku